MYEATLRNRRWPIILAQLTAGQLVHNEISTFGLLTGWDFQAKRQS